MKHSDRPKNKDIPRASDEAVEAAAEEMAGDLIVEFNKWIQPELEKVLGKETVKKLGDLDFDSVVKLECHLLYLEKNHTVHKDGATFYFRLCQGVPGKRAVIAKYQYAMRFENND